jgi:hypothetical protein
MERPGNTRPAGRVAWANRDQLGFAIISQNTATSARKAGKPRTVQVLSRRQ